MSNSCEKNYLKNVHENVYKLCIKRQEHY